MVTATGPRTVVLGAAVTPPTPTTLAALGTQLGAAVDRDEGGSVGLPPPSAGVTVTGAGCRSAGQRESLRGFGRP